MEFSIVHLTDIHFNESKNYILERTDKIIRAINSVLLPNEPVIMVISGDIVFSGKKAEYQIAKKFLDKIRFTISAEKTTNCEIILVPGNHDCDFSVPQTLRERLLSSLDLNSSNVDDETYKAITHLQSEFFNFRTIKF